MVLLACLCVGSTRPHECLARYQGSVCVYMFLVPLKGKPNMRTMTVVVLIDRTNARREPCSPIIYGVLTKLTNVIFAVSFCIDRNQQFLMFTFARLMQCGEKDLFAGFRG
mmetsp:Transcript_14754/g.22492  ORF Transcript_14754/g.22492 Transcript_14754/m.22492 type:complete len:110 (+) Transcript_14754:514-843(+)